MTASTLTGASKVLDAATTTGNSGALHLHKDWVTIQTWLSNTTTPAATVILEGTNEDTPANYTPIYTFSLSGAAAVLGRTVFANYYWLRVRISAISGTNATCSAILRPTEF